MPAGRILVVGHSLGTGVASQLVHHLEKTLSEYPLGLVSICGFKSIPAAASTYPWMKLAIPLPMFYHPNIESLFYSIMTEHLDTKKALQVIICL